MGQRTQTIIRLTDKKASTTTIHVYHDQWGIGCTSPIKLMSTLSMFLFSYDLSTAYRKDDDISEYFLDYQSTDDLHSLLGIYSHCDNNNGGIVVDLIREEYGHIYGKYAFVLGSEDAAGEQPYTRLLSIEEWLKRTHGQDAAGDIDFINWWNAFCRWYELEPVID